MRDFIDKTSEKKGTPLNRDYMMALQGFQANRIIFNEDGSMIETNSIGETKTTTFNEDGSITETFVGQKTITKKTFFVENEIISEVE